MSVPQRFLGGYFMVFLQIYLKAISFAELKYYLKFYYLIEK